MGEIDYGNLVVVWKSGHAGIVRAVFEKEIYQGGLIEMEN